MHMLADIVWFLTVTIAAASTGLNVGDIRLVNGTGPYGGRVEISINGIWGTICDDSFDMNDAIVMCSMMNLRASTYRTGAWFGQGIGPIYAQELKCGGYESHLKDCPFVSNVQCTHARDVGIICTECSEIEISNGYAIDISANGTELTTQCYNGFASNVSKSICMNGKWQPLSITCNYDITDIRLENGICLYDGRVELLVNGTWGTICSTSFSSKEARAICNILFGTTSYRIYHTVSIWYGQGTGPIHIDKLDCKGSETNINECSFRLDVSCTSHSKDAAVACNVQPLNITNTRLVNGTGPYDGRIELYVDGHWGTVCRRNIDMYDAQTICNTHNASLAAYFTSTVYGKGSGPVLIGKMGCSSARDHIKYCSVYSPYRPYCTHDYDLSIVCTSCGLPKIYNGEPFSFNNTELTVKCQAGFFPDNIKMRCLSNGTWVEEQRCTSYNGYPLDISETRLQSSSFPFKRRVEFLVNGTWGTVCDTEFEVADATVVCRMLGLQYTRFYVTTGRSVKGSGTIFVDKLNCNGSESHINNCTYEISNYCTHYDDVSVECTGYHLNITNIRLAGTNGPYHGRVELEVNGTWGTVCGSNYYWNEAVFCRMLGLTYNFRNAYYGPGSGPIYLSRLDCESSMSHVNQCKYAVNNYFNCNHNQDASVICYGPSLNITDARLANGTGPYDGRVEIKVNETWGTICDSNFDLVDANAFCNILGLRAAQLFTGALYGEGSGPVFIDQLFCETYDKDLSSCKYLYLNECSHERDVSVVCNECGQPDISNLDAGYISYNGTIFYADCSYYKTYVGTLKLTCDNVTQSWVTEEECQEYSYPLNVTDVRLADGPRPSSGRVEIKSLDTWGTVCDDNFGMSEAHVICNMIGFPPAVSFNVGAYYGEGKGPIFVDDLSCEDNALDLNDCTYRTYDDCTHENDISVMCTDCGDPKPENGIVSSSSTSYKTVVHVMCETDYKLIGATDVICQLDGNWSSKPMCKLIDCGDPTPEHGSSNTTTTSNGTAVLIECDYGYNMSGEAVITCQSEEKWTNYPSCEITDCNAPKPKNADVTLTGNKTTFGETAIITCWEGHIPSGYGSPTVSCLANGTWEIWQDCVSVDCGFLSLANGEANTTYETTIGSIATIDCDKGYSLNGASVVMCMTNGWNDSSVVCEILTCDDPIPANGKVTSTDGSIGYVFRNYAKIECNVGYELIGDSVITCEDGGVWSGSPSCELIDCGSLTVPSDGNMSDSQGSKYLSEITFSCIKGFLLVGHRKTICTKTGEWTNTVPACIKKSDVGGACVNDLYCSVKYARCINSMCTCNTGIYDTISNKCDIMPLLPYGLSEGDTSVPKTKDCGPKVSFEPGFPAFGSIHKHVYICWFGFISLGSDYSNPTPPKNKIGVSKIRKRSIIAPFYAPISVQNSRAVLYRSYDIHSSYEKMKDDADLISYTEMIVRKLGNVTSFDTSFVLIATWDEVKPLQGFDMSKTSTFQAVLISDGKTTYAFFIYGKMQWKNKLSSGAQIWVGYAGDSMIYSHPYSFEDPVLHLNWKLSGSAKENDVVGLVFKPLTQPGKTYENPTVDCIKWYNENYEDKKRLDFIASMTPECPCDIWLSRYDPWFWKIGLQRWRTDITYACVDMLHVGTYGHYGKRCCYDLRTWLWVYERPYAGGFQLYNPRFPLENTVNDVIPKAKCCDQSDYCKLYYELRPTGSCYKTSPYDFGTFWGDPHFRTLDGMNFTFNGLGEYVLLRIRGNKTFDLHARTERPTKEDGQLSQATIFTAFAAKDSTNASVHVKLNREKNGIILYGNKVDLTNQYYESINSEDPFEWTSNDDNLIISKRDETLSVLFPSFGISLNISVSVEMLSLNTLVNKTLRGHTQGLLGNYNGDPDDDFTLPNGTVLKANLTEREVFAYGQTWAIDPNNSAFIYDNGKSHFDYHNDSYVPRFLNEADPKKVADAEKTCNGSQNIQCVFDLVFIEKPEVALKSNEIKAESDATRLELDESIPSLTGCERVVAIKGEQVNCNFTADHNDEVYFVINSVNATIVKKPSMIVYTQDTEDPVNIRIASRNKYGRSSTTFVLDVVLCTACNNHGNCTDVPRNDDRETEYFRISSCVCEPEYEGPDCEKEFDGCAANPCSLNRMCFTLSSKDQKLLGRSFNCSACPVGYTVDSEDVTKCSDIDECTEQTDKCQQSCTNTEGSFECSCSAGYRIESKDPTKCTDINECEEQLHNCSHKCSNIEGSFACKCFTGYDMDTETGTCTQADDGVCSETEQDGCSDTNGCTIDNEDSVCFCNDGYELDSTRKHCRDIDECSRGLCPHDCVNRNGSFECICYPGFKLEKRTTCKECDVLHWGDNCTKDCICTGRGANRCDNIKGCVCDAGWQGDTCNDDIDECALPTQTCDDPRKECINSVGSYSCKCKAEFNETEQGTCEDLDECSDPRLHNCAQLCENNFGSYSCKCNAGYTRFNETACKDIDECEIGTSKCEQICVNNPGKYSCECYFGYTLSNDRQKCIKLSDPCLKVSNLSCSHFCVLGTNNAKCSCRVGYKLDFDNQTCNDINECDDTAKNKCDKDATCSNTDGSFLCDCPVGMKLENDNRTCSECDSYHFGKNCLLECNCLNGKCDKIKGCVCDPGWDGDFCDTDIDECGTEQLVCNEQNTICVNTLGSATCSCKTGYTHISGVCTDIDECSDIHLNSCDQVCNNTDGSYVCSCRPGFIQKEKCTDIDECAKTHVCDQECLNTAGSYKCSCVEGFTIDQSDRKTCRPEQECSSEEMNTCPDNSVCSRSNGNNTCACVKGFQKSSTGEICEEIDECFSESCQNNGTCIDLVNSYLCECVVGFVGINCEEDISKETTTKSTIKQKNKLGKQRRKFKRKHLKKIGLEYPLLVRFPPLIHPMCFNMYDAKLKNSSASYILHADNDTDLTVKVVLQKIRVGKQGRIKEIHLTSRYHYDILTNETFYTKNFSATDSVGDGVPWELIYSPIASGVSVRKIRVKFGAFEIIVKAYDDGYLGVVTEGLTRHESLTGNGIIGQIMSMQDQVVKIKQIITNVKNKKGKWKAGRRTVVLKVKGSTYVAVWRKLGQSQEQCWKLKKNEEVMLDMTLARVM